MRLVTLLILSRPDYSNSLFFRLSASSVHSLRRIQNCAARAILKKNVKRTLSHLFQFLLWLPISQRVQYMINTLCYKCITLIALSYLCDSLQLYTLSRCTLYSASRFLTPDFPLLLLAPFLTSPPLHTMIFPFLSDRNLLWMASNPTSRRFFSKNNRPAMLCVPRCCLPPPGQVSVVLVFIVFNRLTVV